MFEAAWPAISPEAIEAFFSLAIGFAVAGLCASGYRLFAKHFPSLRLLEVGPVAARFAAIPLLMFCAPFIIMHNTLRGRRIEARRSGIRHGGHRDRRAVEPDVRNGRGDRASSAAQCLITPSSLPGLTRPRAVAFRRAKVPDPFGGQRPGNLG